MSFPKLSTAVKRRAQQINFFSCAVLFRHRRFPQVFNVAQVFQRVCVNDPEG